MSTKKKAVKKEPVVKVNFYEMACDVEKVSIKLEQIKSLLSVTAESCFDSRAELLWLGADLIEEEIKKLDDMVNQIMEVHKEIHK